MLLLWCFVEVVGLCLILSMIDRVLGRQPILRVDKVIPSDPKLLDRSVREMIAALDSAPCWGAEEADVEMIDLVLREALANAIVHGNRCDSQKTVSVSIAVNANYDLLLTVKDSGAGFDPNRIPDPTAPENLLAPHGRGIFLMRELMDEVDFTFDHGTEVRMRRRHKWIESPAHLGARGD
jgi:serine/threonine-protein kinase RsbW